LEGAETAMHGAEIAGSLIMHGISFALVPEILIFLICEEDEPEPQLSDPNTLAKNLAQVCKDKNCSNLFLRFCQAATHSGTGDRILNAGYWHGNLFFDYWTAYNAATAHLQIEPESADKCGVIHFAPSSPG
jgi:hypothetical protein